MTNLSEQEHLDQTARHNPDLLASIIESAMDPIIGVDDAQQIVLFNAAAERMFVCPANEAIGGSVERFMPQRFREGHSSHIRLFGESGITNRTMHGLGTLWGLRATGEEFPIEASISKVESGGKKFFTVAIRDITERKRSEEKSRESEERFRLAAQAGRMFAYEWDAATDLITRSPESAQILGINEAVPITGQQVLAKVHPDDRERLKDAVAALSPENPNLHVSYRIIRPDNTVIWVERNSCAHFDEQGELQRIIGMVADINERHHTEEAVVESEQRFRLAAQAGRMYSYMWDVATDVIVRSGNASGVLGSTGEIPLTRQQLRARVHPDDRAIFDASLSQHTVEHPDVQISYRMLRPDGSVVWVEKTAHAMFDKQGRMVRAVGMVADITERKRAEEALRESEQRFRLVADAAPVMIWMSGPDKKTTYFNKLWMDFTGLSETDLQNSLVGIVHPEDYQQCHEVYCRGFDQLQPFKKECRLRRHDGQYRWMLDIGVPRFHKDGSFAGYIGSCIDVTDHKLAVDSLAEMSRKLAEAQEQERARIARELHDDIGQRLALLAIELEQLQDDPSDVESSVQKLRKEMRAVSKDVQALAHDLHSPSLEYLGAVAGMKSWCKEFAERQKMQIDYRHDVQSTVPDEIGLSLFRVLQEALHNTAKHSGVKRIEVQLHEESGKIHLTVSDSGRGFDVEAVKQGKGLGLTSMRERVRLINGSIAIDSKPMGGTTIHVRVPLVTHASKQVAV